MVWICRSGPEEIRMKNEVSPATSPAHGPWCFARDPGHEHIRLTPFPCGNEGCLRNGVPALRHAVAEPQQCQGVADRLERHHDDDCRPLVILVVSWRYFRRSVCPCSVEVPPWENWYNGARTISGCTTFPPGLRICPEQTAKTRESGRNKGGFSGGKR
jgi:hypothetical protein